MFSRLVTLLPVAALFAVANADTTSQCNTGGNYCCNTSQYLPTTQVSQFSGVLGGVLVGLGVLASVTCTPIDVIAVGGGSSCTQQPVCCTNNNFNGVVNVGCTPINLSL